MEAITFVQKFIARAMNCMHQRPGTAWVDEVGGKEYVFRGSSTKDNSIKLFWHDLDDGQIYSVALSIGEIEKVHIVVHGLANYQI